MGRTALKNAQEKFITSGRVLGTMQIKNQTTIEPLHNDGHLNEVTLTFTHAEKRKVTMTKRGFIVKVALTDKEYERFKNGL